MNTKPKTLTLKGDLAGAARMKLEAHERQLGLKPERETPEEIKTPPARPIRAASASQISILSAETSSAAEPAAPPPAPAQKTGRPGSPPPRPIEWGITVDLGEENRTVRQEQLAAAIAAGEAVPAEPKQTRGLRTAAAIVKNAPSWPIGWLITELKKADKRELASALYHAGYGLRAARFIEVFEKSASFVEERAQKQK